MSRFLFPQYTGYNMVQVLKVMLRPNKVKRCYLCAKSETIDEIRSSFILPFWHLMLLEAFLHTSTS